ncbi:MOSC domain-containing protein [Sorangium cellulosum]|uniref:Molybdenum cofactor biosysynthesis protein n=1 Tax=Sorangium cellulosum So0157-2 TaxID=1254432 RepID=S4XIY4_SORCE|nr:MOSC N-terminal beta barrel domain-containing protein [Sorangium cellulosum]AGP33117.1 molybdenum cofactor biosysynthesis protein [Sorangium cellulosum So0157-2]
MRLSAIHIYPVKGCRGLALDAAAVDELGLVGDRRFMIIDPEGKPLTQRPLPRMALIETQLSEGELTLGAAGRSPISVPRASQSAQGARLLTVEVWSSTGLVAEDCGDEAAAWLSDFLEHPARLVRAGEAFRRPVLKDSVARPEDVVSFADEFPLLVISEASLADLNAHLEDRGAAALPMDRFRPSLVVSGCEAFDEDRWGRVRIGELVLRAGGPCARCVVTTTDQLTAERGPEPLRTLATYRRDPQKPGDVNFGQNYIHETKSGALRVGDEVTLA